MLNKKKRILELWPQIYFLELILRLSLPLIPTFWTSLSFWRQRLWCSASSLLPSFFFLQAGSRPVCLSHPRQEAWCCYIMLLFAKKPSLECLFLIFFVFTKISTFFHVKLPEICENLILFWRKLFLYLILVVSK